MPKKKQTPSQHELTVRDRRSYNKKIAVLIARIDKHEQTIVLTLHMDDRLSALEQALARVLARIEPGLE